MNQEGQEIFDLKPFTKEEVAWLEEYFIDFAREQLRGCVRRNYRDRIRWRIVKLIKMAKIGRWLKQESGEQ